MYGGIIVEEGIVDDIFYNFKYLYIWGFLRFVLKMYLGFKKRFVLIEG